MNSDAAIERTLSGGMISSGDWKKKKSSYNFEENRRNEIFEEREREYEEEEEIFPLNMKKNKESKIEEQ